MGIVQDRATRNIAGRKIIEYRFGCIDPAAPLLIQPVDDHDLEYLDEEVRLISEMTSGKPFTLVAFKVDDWNRDLSPWEAPPVFGSEAFGGGAEDTLRFVTDELIPALNKDSCTCEGLPCTGEGPTPSREALPPPIYLGGYSLAGFFALWAGYRTDIFKGIAAVSPSVWFPGWMDFAREKEPLAPRIYLSLGDKEERTRNPVMKTVGDNIRALHGMLGSRLGEENCILEMNRGNHFVDAAERTAKGFAWLLN